jgi:hypothetical protein
MFYQKNVIFNNLISGIIKNIVESILLNVLFNNIFPKVLYLIKLIYNGLNLGSYNIIYIYMIMAVVILFILYKIFIFFKIKKSKKEVSKSISLSSILSESSDFDLNTKNMERKKSKTTYESKNILTTDLISSYTQKTRSHEKKV